VPANTYGSPRAGLVEAVIAGPAGPKVQLDSVAYPSKMNNAFTPQTTPSSKPLSGSGQPGLGLSPNGGAANPQALDLGLQWRYALHSNYHINVAAWRRVNPPDALTLIQSRQPAYGARVEMQFTGGRRSGFVADALKRHGIEGAKVAE